MSSYSNWSYKEKPPTKTSKGLDDYLQTKMSTSEPFQGQSLTRYLEDLKISKISGRKPPPRPPIKGKLTQRPTSQLSNLKEVIDVPSIFSEEDLEIEIKIKNILRVLAIVLSLLAIILAGFKIIVGRDLIPVISTNVLLIILISLAALSGVIYLIL
jgi:hypothetical protein